MFFTAQSMAFTADSSLVPRGGAEAVLTPQPQPRPCCRQTRPRRLLAPTNLNTIFKSSRGSGMRRRNTRHRHCKKVRRPVFSLTPLVAVTPLPARAVLHCEAETAIVAAARCLVPSPAIIIRRYVCLSAVDVEVCQRHVAAVGPKLRTGRGGGGGRN